MAIIVWSGTGLASAGANWVGGVAPSTNDTAKFDGTSVNACTWDIAQVSGVDITILYTGVVTQIVSLRVNGPFTIVSATNEWDMNTLDLLISGTLNDSGVGLGITNGTGSLILAGDAFVNHLTFNRFENVVFVGDLDNHNNAKTHAISWGAGTEQINSMTIADNQDFILNGTFAAVDASFGVGCSIRDSGNARTLRIISGGTWVNIENVLFISTALDRLLIDYKGNTTISGIYYGQSKFVFSSSGSFSIFGSWIGSGTLQLKSSSQQTIRLKPVGVIVCGDLQIGNETNASRACDFTQESGSLVKPSGNVLITSDDTFAVTKWTREAGVLDSTIGGNLTVEADAALDFANDTSTISVGGVTSINAASICNFGLTTLRHSGDIKNAGFSNIFNELVSETSSTPIVLLDDIGANRWSFTGTGDIDIAAATNSISLRADGPQMVGADLVNWVFDGGSINFLTSSSATYNGLFTIPSANYRSHTELRRSGTGNRRLRILGDVTFKNVTPRDFTVDCNGFNLTCETFDDSADPYRLELNNGSITASGDIRLDNAASIITTDGTITARDILHNAGTINVTETNFYIRSYIPVAGAGYTFEGGAGVMSLTGDFNPANLADPSFNPDNLTIRFSGSGVQVFNFDTMFALSVRYIQSAKIGGTLKINHSQISNSEIQFNAFYGSHTVEFLAGVAYTFKTWQSFGIAGNKVSVTSSVPATKIVYNITNPELPSMHYIGWKDSDVQGIIQNVDTSSGSDDGNNTIAGPNGLNFVVDPPHVPQGLAQSVIATLEDAHVLETI